MGDDGLCACLGERGEGVCMLWVCVFMPWVGGCMNVWVPVCVCMPWVGGCMNVCVPVCLHALCVCVLECVCAYVCLHALGGCVHEYALYLCVDVNAVGV